MDINTIEVFKEYEKDVEETNATLQDSIERIQKFKAELADLTTELDHSISLLKEMQNDNQENFDDAKKKFEAGTLGKYFHLYLGRGLYGTAFKAHLMRLMQVMEYRSREFRNKFQ